MKGFIFINAVGQYATLENSKGQQTGVLSFTFELDRAKLFQSKSSAIKVYPILANCEALNASIIKSTVVAVRPSFQPLPYCFVQLLKHMQAAHNFIEHTEAFGLEAASGILKCSNIEWDIDKSKQVVKDCLDLMLVK